ncbi:hypothetical protein [Bradyrhizobium sp. 151]|uniref:hypothetical protein n=1 Tax=Bradyrhizobium sp. 151 TaxID=2782626 RepID=UPI001FF7583A|nr:hypothetical protein [Bradyrhizobium sp. 151]MCK1661269.1 hypothetical protein [Bradyrhizobium sp. 151]
MEKGPQIEVNDLARRWHGQRDSGGAALDCRRQVLGASITKRLVILAAVTMAFSAASEAGPDYRPEDSAIRCFSVEDCQRLVGRKLWVTVNTNEMCATIGTGCRKLPINFGVVVQEIASRGNGPLDRYLKVRAQDGTIGYINVANAHLLTYTDPGPAIAARKKREEEEAAKRAKQSAIDAALIASTPKETFEKACILAAAERLPRIPGIQIKNSKAGPPPPGTNVPPDRYTGVVDIVAIAAGQEVTYTFACAVGTRTPAVVVPVSQR